MNDKIVAVVGPTASGKTGAAVRLASILNGEIVSCDSMQVYKDMPVLTQCPSEEELAAAGHHLVSHVAPEEEYSAAAFAKEAAAIIESVCRGGRVPIITGGTGLYLKALVDGLFPSPAKNTELRERLLKDAEKEGPSYLYDRLKAADPDTAAKVHPNDAKRIIRALEVFYLTGVPMSVHKKNTEGIKGRYKITMFGINPPRPILYERINARVDRMIENGAVDEVRCLLGRKLSITARFALGIKEITGYIEGEYDMETAKELLKQNTRRYAKRQLTWFRADKRIRWFDEGEGIINHCRNGI